jgi:DNA (cytosine-5)-methyltransferase 1
MNKANRHKTTTGSEYTFIDLFAGIGGFHIALHNLGSRCVFISEFDKYARQTYEHNFSKIVPDLISSDNFAGDITKINAKDIPEFDILCAGFPCQPFSVAGYKKGFDDTRGTLFFDIARIIKEKKPQAFILENVKGLFIHNNGQTLLRMKEVLESLGYSFFYKILKADDYGVPQNRQRLLMVGFRNKAIEFEFPKPFPLKTTMSDILGGNCPKTVGYTLRVGGRGSGMGDRRNWDTYLVDGKEVRLKPQHALKMQGFPDDFHFPVSEAQAMKQLGNSVAIPMIQAVAEQVFISLNNKNSDNSK